MQGFLHLGLFPSFFSGRCQNIGCSIFGHYCYYGWGWREVPNTDECVDCVDLARQDRSCSPSVLRCVSTTWKEGLLNRKRPFVGLCCHSCTPQSQVHPPLTSTATLHQLTLAQRLRFFVCTMSAANDTFCITFLRRRLAEGRVFVYKQHAHSFVLYLFASFRRDCLIPVFHPWAYGTSSTSTRPTPGKVHCCITDC